MDEHNKNLLENLENLPNRYYDPIEDKVYKLHIFRDKGLWVIEYHEEGMQQEGRFFEERSMELLLAVKEMMYNLNEKQVGDLIFKQ